jgi:hypothetical protein
MVSIYAEGRAGPFPRFESALIREKARNASAALGAAVAASGPALAFGGGHGGGFGGGHMGGGFGGGFRALGRTHTREGWQDNTVIQMEIGGPSPP